MAKARQSEQEVQLAGVRKAFCCVSAGSPSWEMQNLCRIQMLGEALNESSGLFLCLGKSLVFLIRNGNCSHVVVGLHF